MNPNALNLLGISNKAGALAVGEEPVAAAARSHKARLILVAQDAADHTFRRAKSFSTAGKCAFIRIPWSKAQVGGILGRSSCALLAITDVRLAASFIRQLGEAERYQDILEELDQRAARIDLRRQEQEAHKKNLRRGKHK